MNINLTKQDPSELLAPLQTAFSLAPESLTIEILGPGIILHDTALMLYDEICNRPPGLKVHAFSRTCLIDGAILIWLAADTRSMRPDGWIQISRPREKFASLHMPPEIKRNYSTAILADEEAPNDTDLRTIHRHLGQWLPVNEIVGLRLFPADLTQLGLIDDAASLQELDSLFCYDSSLPMKGS